MFSGTPNHVQKDTQDMEVLRPIPPLNMDAWQAYHAYPYRHLPHLSNSKCECLRPYAGSVYSPTHPAKSFSASSSSCATARKVDCHEMQRARGSDQVLLWQTHLYCMQYSVSFDVFLLEFRSSASITSSGRSSMPRKFSPRYTWPFSQPAVHVHIQYQW